MLNIDGEISEKQEQNEDFEAKVNELNEHQQELETVRQELDAQRESLRALEDEREEISSALEESQELSDDRLETIEADIQQLRQKRDRIGSTVDELQTVIQFNENLLDGDLGVFGELHDREGEVTDKLLESGEDIVCWTCGNDIDTNQVETMLENLRDLRNRHMDRRSELESEIDELTSERERIEEKQRQHERNKSRLRTVEDEIERRTARLEDLQAREETLSTELDELEEELETLRADERPDSGLSELRKEASRLEVEIDRLESDLSSIEDEIDRIESRIDERDDLEEQREEVQSQIADLRMRIDQLEADSAEQFNDHMEAILDVLEYANLERIWIERTEKEVQRGRQTVTEGQFELHVVRNTESGAAYEDTVDHLSESEREVTGLVFALAGYLVHEVHDEVPFMLLDSVEAIDAPRLSSLVDYFSDYAENLVIALLEEDARALDESYQRVTNI